MNVIIRTLSSTKDISDCLRQLDSEFGARLTRLASAQPAFERIGGLQIFIVGSHPLSGHREPGRGTYEKKTELYYVSASVDYHGATSSSWIKRVQAYAETAARAARKIAKTRISDAERELLLNLISNAERETAANEPFAIETPGAVFIKDPIAGVDGVPLISFSGRGGPGMIEVMPGEIEKYLQTMAERAVAAPSSMFKLYAKSDAKLLYREAWIEEGSLVHEHWGLVGERGDHRRQSFADAAAAKRPWNA